VIAYFDASAFLKLVVEEPGSAEARDTWEAANTRSSSMLLYPEARAGLARAHRMRRIGRSGLRAAVEDVDRFCRQAVLLGVTEELTRIAGGLAEEHGLRAYDAVHLASVASVADDQTVLVAADGDLVRAARAHGLATAAL
jgi:predicted nucleic acid-binding protein